MHKSIIREKAKQLTKNIKVNNLPIDPIKLISKEYDVDLIVTDLCGEDGYTFYNKKKDKYRIYINKLTNNIARMNFTIAHECGHIYLEHFKKYDNFNNPFVLKTLDVEANCFAAAVLIPENLLYKSNLLALNNEHLAKLFGVSLQAFNIRMDAIHLTLNNIVS